MTPASWDALKATWKQILQEEGKARHRRISAKLNELLRRIQIIRWADTLTACTNEHLETLQFKYNRLVQEKTSRKTRDHQLQDTIVNHPTCVGNGRMRISEIELANGSTTTDPGEIASAIYNHFKRQFEADDQDDSDDERLC